MSQKPNVFPDKEETTSNPQPTHASGISQAEMEAAQKMLENTQQQIADMQTVHNIDAAPADAVPNTSNLSPLSNMDTRNMTDKHGDLMKPKWDSPFDKIPLPSGGKLYKNIKDRIKVSYMTGSDENILTSPNLIESGDFLEILLSRNLLEPNLSYKDLHLGDRNAIMIWLRGTAFGNMYPITVYSKKGDVIEAEIDLSELEYIPLGAEPDENQEFDFKCPSGNELKFKFLTVGDEDEIDAILDEEQKNGVELNNRSTYSLMKQIKSVDGNRDSDFIAHYISNMRLIDIKAFRTYINDIESGIDLKIEVQAGGGESVTTFLPLNLNFFWPDI